MSHPTQAALDAIAAGVLARAISPRAGMIATHALGGDPSSLILPCEAEGCTNTIRQGDSLSLIGVAHTIAGTALAMTGPHQVQPTQCIDEQHYGCSLEHALAAHIQCLQTHVFPKHQAKVDAHLATQRRPLVEGTASAAEDAPQSSAPAMISDPQLTGEPVRTDPPPAAIPEAAEDVARAPEQDTVVHEEITASVEVAPQPSEDVAQAVPEATET